MYSILKNYSHLYTVKSRYTMKKYLFVALFLVLITNVFGQQDSIVLLNGKVYRGTIKSVDENALFYVGFDKKDGDLPIEITTDRLFSYVMNGDEKIVYKKDEFKGDFLSVDEARITTLGSYDARQMFKPRFVFWSSLAIGLGASIVDTYYTQKSYDAFFSVNMVAPSHAVVGFFGTGPTIMPLLGPMVLSAVWGLPSFKIKGDQIIQKDLIGNELYYRGFHRIARQKRVFGAIKGSVIGIGVGMISYAILRQN